MSGGGAAMGGRSAVNAASAAVAPTNTSVCGVRCRGADGSGGASTCAARSADGGAAAAGAVCDRWGSWCEGERPAWLRALRSFCALVSAEARNPASALFFERSSSASSRSLEWSTLATPSSCVRCSSSWRRRFSSSCCCASCGSCAGCGCCANCARNLCTSRSSSAEALPPGTSCSGGTSLDSRAANFAQTFRSKEVEDVLKSRDLAA
mmetsp:Transcript_114851/g.366369  ORF Transcript_114851/g.366369 Transcript_114851/m.366369 type:complete len:208 (+) Transcript_114851:300-923(+)